MPEKVTPLNGLKVTLEYCSYNLNTHNKDYVKYSNKLHYKSISYTLPYPFSSNLTVVTLKIMSVPEFSMP